MQWGAVHTILKIINTNSKEALGIVSNVRVPLFGSKYLMTTQVVGLNVLIAS